MKWKYGERNGNGVTVGSIRVVWKSTQGNTKRTARVWVEIWTWNQRHMKQAYRPFDGDSRWGTLVNRQGMSPLTEVLSVSPEKVLHLFRQNTPRNRSNVKLNRQVYWDVTSRRFVNTHRCVTNVTIFRNVGNYWPLNAMQHPSTVGLHLQQHHWTSHLV